MKKTFLKYWTICTLFNIAIVFTTGAIFELIVININQFPSMIPRTMERIDINDVAYLLFANILVSFLLPLLYIFKLKNIRPRLILLLFNLGFILVYLFFSRVFYYQWPERIGNKDWFHDIFLVLCLTLPQAFIIPTLINFFQTIMKRELLTLSIHKETNFSLDHNSDLSTSYKEHINKDTDIKRKSNYFLISIVLCSPLS
jgi:hypothetical protein